MNFKFSENFKKLSVKCPPEHYKSKNMTVYRWIFDEINDERNFQPLACRNPKRILNFDDSKKCQSFALSFYNTENNARQQFSLLKEQIGNNVYRNLGTKVACGNITEEDGVSDEPNFETGHISHHPVAGQQYEKRFSITSTL
jgi:hypothetical protein